MHFLNFPPKLWRSSAHSYRADMKLYFDFIYFSLYNLFKLWQAKPEIGDWASLYASLSQTINIECTRKYYSCLIWSTYFLKILEISWKTFVWTGEFRYLSKVPRWRWVSVKTKGHKIDFVGDHIFESTAWFSNMIFITLSSSLYFWPYQYK